MACRPTAAILLLALLSAPGCGYLEMIKRRRTLRAEFENQPRLSIQRTLAPEKCLRVIGPFTPDSGPPLRMIVAAIGRRYDVPEVAGWRNVESEFGLYSLLVPGGEYQFVALADLDGNGRYEDGEVIGSTAADEPAVVRKRLARDGYLVDGPTIAVDRVHPRTIGVPIRIDVSQQGYLVPSLDDDFFNPGWGQVGLWDPDALMVHTQGFMFALEEFDPNRTQVLFVHGAGGTPRDFREIVAGLDRSKFQPTFFYYPSGLPLAQMGAVLQQLVTLVETHPKFKPHRLVIIAHSMGGLVARAAVAELTQKGVPSWLSLFVTMSSPYAGMTQAGLAVEQAPELVPSWEDLAPGSTFLQKMADTRIPEELPFYILFGYDNDGSYRRSVSGDSVVPLSSQIPTEAQAQANRMFGIDTTHVGILRDPATRRILNTLLVRYAAPQGVLGRTAETITNAVGNLLPGSAKSEPDDEPRAVPPATH